MPGFWIYHGSENTNVTQASECARISLNNFWNPWLSLDIPECAWFTSIWVNMIKSVWMNFVLHAPILTPCLLKSVVTYFYTVYSLKENEVTILFSCRDFKRLKIFTSKISSLLFPLDVESWELWIWIYHSRVLGLPTAELITHPLVFLSSIQGRIQNPVLKYAERTSVG